MCQAPALSLLMALYNASALSHLILTTTMRRNKMSPEILSFTFFNIDSFSDELKEQFATLVSTLLN